MSNGMDSDVDADSSIVPQPIVKWAGGRGLESNEK